MSGIGHTRSRIQKKNDENIVNDFPLGWNTGWIKAMAIVF